MLPIEAPPYESSRFGEQRAVPWAVPGEVVPKRGHPVRPVPWYLVVPGGITDRASLPRPRARPRPHTARRRRRSRPSCSRGLSPRRVSIDAAGYRKASRGAPGRPPRAVRVSVRTSSRGRLRRRAVHARGPRFARAPGSGAVRGFAARPPVVGRRECRPRSFYPRRERPARRVTSSARGRRSRLRSREAARLRPRRGRLAQWGSRAVRRAARRDSRAQTQRTVHGAGCRRGQPPGVGSGRRTRSFFGVAS